MTVASATSRVAYAGDDLSTVFAVPYVFFDETDLTVVLRDDATGDEDVLSGGVDYTVSGGAGSTGSVTATVAPATGETLTILRQLVVLQEVDFVNNSASDAETLEDLLDRLTQMLQQLKDKTDRALLAPRSESSIDLLPAAVVRANKVLAFDDDGEPVAAGVADLDLAIVSDYMNDTFLALNSAGEVKTELGLGATDSPTFDSLKLNDTDDSHQLTVSVGSNLTAARALSLVTGDADRTITLSGNPTLADWFNQSVKTTATADFAGVGLADSNASHFLRLNAGSDLTANRTLNIVTGDAGRTVTLSGNPTLDDWFDQSVKTTATPTFANVRITDQLRINDTDDSHYLAVVPGSDLTANRTLTLTTGDANRTLTISGDSTVDQNVSSTGTPTFAAMRLADTDASNSLRLVCNSDLTAQRDLNFVTGDSGRTITLSGNPTLADWFDQSVKTTGSPSFANLTATSSFTSPGIDDNADAIALTINSTEQVIITNTGTTGTSQTMVDRTGAAVTGRLQVTTSGGNAAISQQVWNSGATNCVLNQFRSRSATVGTFTVVQLGDVLGEIVWSGADGTDAEPAAAIWVDIQSTPGAGDMPGSMHFGTTADGAEAVTEHMILNASGQLVLNTDRMLRFLNQTSGAGAGAGTLSNAPAAGNPTFYLKVIINGTNYAIPCWPG